jgi:methionyl-tRNA formyltransferase
MRILLFANNWVGWQIASWLKDRGDEIVGLVIHPPDKRKYGDEIRGSVNLTASCVFDGSKLRQPEVINMISQLRADLGLSILFDYILCSDLIRLFPAGVINLHPSYLPYPGGGTLHYIDGGVDTGDIIARKQVLVEPVDTGETLYRKLERACVELFKETWPLILRGQIAHIPQSVEAGTYHCTRDVEQIDEIEIDRTYTARELINIFRARTFAPYAGAYFWVGERKVYLRLQLLYEDELRRNHSGKNN